MIAHTFSSEGMILGRKNYGEADRMLSIYSKNMGRISMIAKGVRKPKSRKRGHIEIFSYIKYQVVTAKGMFIMTEAEVIDDFASIRLSLKKISLAYYFIEVLAKITHEGQANDDLFYLLLNFFKELKSTHNLKNLRIKFIHELLVLLGFWPAGKELNDPDGVLEEVIEKQISSIRVGRRILV